MILKDINAYLEKSGYELYYENLSLMKRRGKTTGACTGLEEYMVETLQMEPPDEMARRVLGLVKSVLGAERR